MKTLCHLLLILTACMPLRAAEPEQTTFKTLAAATRLLDRAVETNNRKLLLAIMPSSSTTVLSQQPAVFEQLARERQRTGDLSKLYKDREFPAGKDTFKLGGHDKELGHIHIDFIRDGDSWKLKDIWQCR
jgi:hypothetical protein